MPRSVTPIITCRRQHHTRHVSPGQLCLVIYVQADCGQRLFFSTPTPPCLVLPDQQSDMGSGASDRTLRSNLKSVVAMQLPASRGTSGCRRCRTTQRLRSYRPATRPWCCWRSCRPCSSPSLTSAWTTIRRLPPGRRSLGRSSAAPTRVWDSARLAAGRPPADSAEEWPQTACVPRGAALWHLLGYRNVIWWNTHLSLPHNASTRKNAEMRCSRRYVSELWDH